MLEIRLLGEVELRRDGTKLPLPRSRKTRCLLAYLVSTGRSHRRERLCSLFWDLPDDPRGALRWSLSKLRPLVDEPDCKRILADRQSVAFNGLGADIDTEILRRNLAKDMQALSTGKLEELAKLFRGEFLEGLELSNCPDFQAWCAAERQDIQHLEEEILQTLVDRLSTKADAALSYARKLTELHPYDDSARAQLMLLLASTGRQHEADQQFELGQQLSEEVGGIRSDLLERARQEILEGSKSDRVDPSHSPALPPMAHIELAPDALDSDRAEQGEQLPLPAEPSIVVMPFVAEGGNGEQDYFTHGVTEELTNLISSIDTFFVIAPSTAFAISSPSYNSQRVARRLGVGYVLEGSVARDGGEIELAARLLDGASGDVIWRERYDGPLHQAATLLRELAGAVVHAMAPAFRDHSINLVGKMGISTSAAEDLCLRGRWHLYLGTPKDLKQAIALFRQAAEVEPELSQAWSGLAEACHRLTDQDLADPSMDRYELALKAVQLDGKDTAARCVLGRAHLVKRQHEAAISEFHTALEMNASLAEAYRGLGAALVFSGKPKDAIPHLERARRLGPYDQSMGETLERLADAHLLLREHGKSVELARQALDYWPFQWSRYAVLISALGHLGRTEEARAILAELLRHQPDFTLEFARASHFFAGQVALDFVAEPQLFTDQDEFAYYLDGLQKVGVPTGVAAAASDSGC